ncbi:MAG: hypothetical protein HY422_02135 [Candidatus Komeilibacteria bacterium]|nr:hypothetical protein [Candidatus Komeilibacteria bacterium]
MGSIDTIDNVPKPRPSRTPEIPDQEDDSEVLKDESADTALRMEPIGSEAPSNPFERNVDSKTLADLDRTTRDRPIARTPKTKPEPFPAREATSQESVAEAEPVKPIVAELTDAPAEKKPEQELRFDTGELDTLKSGDALVGVTGGRAVIKDRRENEGTVLFDILFRGDPKMRTFTLDQLRNAGAGIQSIERGPEKFAGSASPEATPAEQAQSSKTFDRVFLEEFKKIPAQTFKSKKEMPPDDPISKVQADMPEQVGGSKRYDREFLEVLRATPAERFSKESEPGTTRKEEKQPGTQEVFADLLKTEQVPQASRKERSTQRRKDDEKAWESGDSGSKALRGTKNNAPKVPGTERPDSSLRSPASSSGPDPGELLRVKKTPSDGNGTGELTAEQLANPNLDTITDLHEPEDIREAVSAVVEAQGPARVEDLDRPQQPEAQEALDEVQKLPEKEKKSWVEGMANIGFSIQAWKSKKLQRVYEFASRHVGSKDEKGSTFSQGVNYVLRSYADFYAKQERGALNQIERKGKSGLAQSAGIMQGAGNLFKAGRVIFDVATHGSLKYFNPFRHVTIGAIFVGRNAEILKEARLNAERVKEKTLVADVDRAYDEAQEIYQGAQHESGAVPTREDLDRAYDRFIPKNIIDRLNRAKENEALDAAGEMYRFASEGKPEGFVPTKGDLEQASERYDKVKFVDRLNKTDTNRAAFLLSQMMQKVGEKHIRWAAERVSKKIAAIESSALPEPEQKAKIQKLYARQKKFFADFDRMVSDAGTIDHLSYIGYNVEHAGKRAANILILDTARLLIGSALESSAVLDRFTRDTDAIAPDTAHEALPHVVPEAAASAAQETAHHAPAPGLEHAVPIVPDDSKQMAADILPQSEVPHAPVEHPGQEIGAIDMTHGTAASGAAEIPTAAAQAGEHAASEPAVGAAVHAAEHASSVPIAEHAGMLGVEIHQGEGMIEAVGRTFEMQYGVPHERAMALANRVWAEHDPQRWYNLVHSGDTFSVDVHGVTPDMLKTGDISELAKQIEYNPGHFEAASGLEPGHALPHHEAVHEAVAASQAPEAAAAVTTLGKGFTAEQALAYYGNLPDHPVTIDATSAQFLAEHQIHYDTATHQLWRDLNADGVHDMTSDKTVTLQIPNPENITTVKLAGGSFPGQLIVEAWGKEGQHLGSFVLNADLDSVQQTVAAAVSSETPFVSTELRFSQRFITKLGEFQRHVGSTDWLHKTAPSISKDELAAIPAQVASGSKRELMKYLETKCEAPKGEAKAMAKTLHYIFDGLKKGLHRAGEKGFETNETVGGVLKTLDLNSGR